MTNTVDTPAGRKGSGVATRSINGANGVTIRIVSPRGPRTEPESDTTRPLQVRLENTPVGRALINAGIIVTLAAILVVSMPASVIRSTLLVWAQPYLSAVGLGEDWGVFAPSPRTTVIYGTARIRYSDGTSSEWSFPTRPGLMAYSDYRWQKFEEHVRLDGYSGLWQPFARYLARHKSTPDHTPVRVDLTRRWADIHPPGVRPSLGPWAQYVYYIMPVGAPPVGAPR